MKQQEDVECMLTLHTLGWGHKRIAKELGISKNTVKKYLKQKGWVPYKSPKRKKVTSGLEDRIKEYFFIHRGNADVVRQELLKNHSRYISLRTIERAVKPFRDELQVKAQATLRFETPPGKQLQIDFGSTRLYIQDKLTQVFLFVATLGFSRRIYVKPFLHEQQSSWFKGIEEAFFYFGGTTEEVLVDNAKSLITKHYALTREVQFNERFTAFANYWRFCPKACAPYRARTKGKDERAIGYVKRNAIAGHKFASWESLESHLEHWMHNISDQRLHGTTRKIPLEVFEEMEKDALRPLKGKPPFLQIRELDRIVHKDACVEIDTNRYSVPWKIIKERVFVQLIENEVRIFYKQTEIARHVECKGKYQNILNPEHLKGIVGTFRPKEHEEIKCVENLNFMDAELSRPLADYERLVGGSWS
ncbi:IS21 family transposase [Neochlamydia sp. S13]|uniref:IS21 family transposase n=1 Tax=Neochlamydia sp. S13 TaxID=1353976 RepID=UPI000FD175C5|nr:IS21 family transposase [Neochlamydia sp. S13]BBI17242.1 Uncharacterized protein NCS13_1_1047 [Neochlamydia sp. S13]BBI17779.1 Uncharacterized protein NCS13_1_1584 [Neochlamydia sp. S13]